MNKTRRTPAARPVDNRSADTRRRLLEAGLKLFGQSGLEAVTTRDLAKAAGVNLAAIPYHFGSKEGVYLAVAEFIIEQHGSKFLARLAPLEEALANPKTPKKELVEGLVSYAIGTLHNMAASPYRLPAMLFILREQVRPTAAFDTLYTQVMGPTLAVLDRVVGRLLDLPADHPDVKITVHMFWAYQFVDMTTRAALTRRMGWKDIGEAELQKLAEIMAATIRREFDSKR